MELSLASAFSTGGLVGHLSYLLLVVSMAMRSMLWLRVLVIASAFTGITYDLVWLKDPIGVFWESLLVAVNIIQIFLLWRHDRMARFNEEEQYFATVRLRGLSPGQARRLIDAGRWMDANGGEVLTEMGRAPEHLTFVAVGTVGIHVNSKRIAECGRGAFVGEMSLIDEGTASATAVVEGRARLWQIPIAKLQSLRDTAPEQTAALDAAIARDIRKKLVEHNARQAAAHG